MKILQMLEALNPMSAQREVERITAASVRRARECDQLAVDFQISGLPGIAELFRAESTKARHTTTEEDLP